MAHRARVRPRARGSHLADAARSGTRTARALDEVDVAAGEPSRAGYRYGVLVPGGAVRPG